MEKDNGQQGEELVEVDDQEKLKKVTKEKKGEQTEEKGSSKTFLIIGILLVLILIIVAFIYMRNKKKSPIELIRVKNADEMAKVGGDIVISFLKKNPNLVLGLASGGTPKGLYKYLIENYKNKTISFKDVKAMGVDEFCGIPKTHVQSYYYILHQNILNHIDIQESNVHLLNSEGKDLKDFEKNAEDYEKLLAASPIDLQILSIGGNGHFGFNEPGTPFETNTHIIKLADKVREDKKKLFENDLTKTPVYSISQGVQTLLKAKTILIIANGKGKAEAIKSIMEGEPTINFPISWVKKHTGKVYVVADEEACSLLSK